MNRIPFIRFLMISAVLCLAVLCACSGDKTGQDTTADTSAPTEPAVTETPVTAPATEPETETEATTEPAVWSPDVIAWYDVDNGSSCNTRPDNGWYFPYAETPGVTTKDGMFRSATPLLGTYDQGDIAVARQHLYWLGEAGFTALAVDVTNVRSWKNNTEKGMQLYYEGVYKHTETLFAAAKSLCDEGVVNVPKIYVSVRMFGEDYAALADVLAEYRELYEKYPAQCWHQSGNDKPFIAVFVDHAVYNTWGSNPKTDVVDDFFDFRWTNGYLAGYAKDDGKGGKAISAARKMWLFVENWKGTENGSYAPIYTAGADGSPEMMVASVSVHGGWNDDGSNWDAINHTVGGRTTLERQLEPVFAYQPKVVIIDRFNYPLVWREQPQEGLGLYHSGHYEPCQELGFDVLYAVTRQVFAMRGLTGEGPAAVTDGKSSDGYFMPDMKVLPAEYRIGTTKDLSGAEWCMMSLEKGIDYRLFTGVDTLYVQTRNAFGESEVTRITVEKLKSSAEPFVFEFEPYGSESKWNKAGNSWASADNFTMWVTDEWSGGAALYCSMHVDEKPNPDSAITTSLTVPTPGKYNVRVGFIRNGTSPVVQLYLDGQPLGDAFDAFAGSPTYDSLTLGTITLTAGDHILSIRSEETNSGRWEIWLDALLFEPSD